MMYCTYFLVFLACCVHSQSTPESLPKSSEAPVKPTTEAPKPTTEVPVKPTTEAPMKPTTEAPKPPTEAPVAPTTDAPVKPTTEAPVKPTTEAPVKPTTQAPVKPTTQAPVAPTTQAPPVGPPTFMVKDANGTVCIMVKGYLTTILTIGDQEVVTNVTSTATVTDKSKCGNDTQILELSFGVSTLTFNFKSNLEEFYVTEISLVSNEEDFGIGNLTKFKAGKTHSYECNSLSNITLTTPSKATDEAILSTKNLQVEAFFSGEKDPKKPTFGLSQQCPADTETDNYVPIAVGAALAALVVIVLVAYLISRTRNRGGYESV